VTSDSPLALLRAARARIDLDRLAANYDAIHAAAGLPVMPVVKADAYGHGAATVARALAAKGAPLLAVAYAEEGVALRQAGITLPVVAPYDLTPVVSTPLTLTALIAHSRDGARPRAHVKVDTGMGRLGFATDAFVEAALRLRDAGIEVEGAMTHLACADEDAGATARQLDRFDDAVARLAARGMRPPLIHACNSAGLAFVRPTHTMVRPGLMVYGVKPRPLSPEIDVRPVMQLSADISLVKSVAQGTRVSYGGRWIAARPSRIATIPLGYADGVPRTDRMRDLGAFRIGPGRVPVAGTVCMDLTTADVTDRPDVVDGTEAVLFGDDPTAWDVAAWAGTTSWEILTSVGSRVPRVYVQGGRVVHVESRYRP
jgi:alanine racemase